MLTAALLAVQPMCNAAAGYAESLPAPLVPVRLPQSYVFRHSSIPVTLRIYYFCTCGQVLRLPQPTVPDRLSSKAVVGP